MATSTTINTTYAGEKAAPYISAALLSCVTFNNGGLTIKPNIKKRQVIKTLEVGGLIADGSCDFTPTGNLIVDERYIDPKELQVNLELCKQDFRDDWDAIQMGYSAFDKMPKDFQSYLIAEVSAKVAANHESILWNGVEGTGTYDGLITKMVADGDTLSVAGAAAVTAANVIEKLGEVVDLIPDTIYGDEDLHIYVSQHIYRSYVRALGGFGAAGLGAAGFQDRGNNQSFGPLVFDGVKIFMANGLTTNQMVAAKKSNLWFGTGLVSDWSLVKVIDMADIDGSQNVSYVMRFTGAVNYGFGQEVVLYNPA